MFRHDPATLRCMKASDASGVARYLDPYNPKGITKDEVADIHAAGLALHLFFETTGGANDPGYFTRAQGVADCLAAQDELAKISAPKGTVVYFAIDINIEPSRVTEYANGIESVATDAIAPGLYGYQRLCEYAYHNYPNIGKHLWQTYGTPTVPLDAWQHLQEDRCGVQVDVNDANVPGWKPQEVVLATPQYAGQSVSQVSLVVGEVSTEVAFYDYGQGPRPIVFKFYATKPGMWPVIHYPPADPDADPTQDLAAQPALFVVAVRAAP